MSFFSPLCFLEAWLVVRTFADVGFCSDFEFWNFTYVMPEGFEGVPNLMLSFEVV